MEFKDTLKAARQARALSQKELAAEHNAYFVTDTVPVGTIYLGETAISVGEERHLR